MKTYYFWSRDWSGKQIKGSVEARGEKEAKELVAKKNLVLVNIKERKESTLGVFWVKLTNRVGLKKLVNFTRQLSTMMMSGLPLTDALALLVEQEKPRSRMRLIVEDALEGVQSGQSLASSIEKAKDVFGEAYVASVKAGEEGGVLEKVLERLSDNLEKRQEFGAKLKGAMIYPVIVIVGMLGVMVVMMVVVVPKLSTMYEDFGGAQMPLATRVLMGISTGFTKVWFVFPFVLFAFVFVSKTAKLSKQMAIKLDNWKFKIPIAGSLRRKSIISDACRTLSMLLEAGIALIDALLIVGKATGSIYYKSAFEEIATKVEKGFALSEAMKESGAFPLIVEQMASTGEETGKLDEVMGKIAYYFSAEAEQSVKALTSAMEPLIMVVLGIGVGFLVIAVVMPIYNLTSQF